MEYINTRIQLLIGVDQYNDKNELVVGNSVTNAMFQFTRGAPILKLAMSLVTSVYDPSQWTSVGPDLLQRSLLTTCGFPPSQPLRELAMTRKHFRSGFIEIQQAILNMLKLKSLLMKQICSLGV